MLKKSDTIITKGFLTKDSNARSKLKVCLFDHWSQNLSFYWRTMCIRPSIITAAYPPWVFIGWEYESQSRKVKILWLSTLTHRCADPFLHHRAKNGNKGRPFSLQIWQRAVGSFDGVPKLFESDQETKIGNSWTFVVFIWRELDLKVKLM